MTNRLRFKPTANNAFLWYSAIEHLGFVLNVHNIKRKQSLYCINTLKAMRYHASLIKNQNPKCVNTTDC